MICDSESSNGVIKDFPVTVIAIDGYSVIIIRRIGYVN